MAAKQDPVSGLNYGWTLGEDNWNVGMDSNLVKLGSTININVTDFVANPVVSTNGTRYLVQSGSGAFAGQSGKLAVRVEGVWTFYTLPEGCIVYNLTDSTHYKLEVGVPTVLSSGGVIVEDSLVSDSSVNAASVHQVKLVSDALSDKEPTIPTGSTSQYVRGDKTLATLDKAAVGLSNVVNADTTTTANIVDSLDKRFVTDAQSAKIDTVSGTNTGDETTATIKTKLGAASSVTDGYLSSSDWNTFNNNQNAANAAISEANAAASALAAETARDAAFTNADVYASTALALAATTNTQQFSVVSGNFLNRYRNDSGVATLIAQTPNGAAIPLSTYYSQRHLVVQRDISGALNLLIPSATIERNGAFVSVSAPANNRYTVQPLSTTTAQRRHFVSPITGALSFVDGVTSPQPDYDNELLATSVNGVVSSGKYRVIGDMNTVPNLFPYGKDTTEVTKTSGGQLVAISDSSLTTLGFTYGWGNVSGSAFHGLDLDDAVESPYYFVRVYQQHDGTVVLPTVTITYTDGSNLQFNPGIEQTLSANTCSHSGFGRVAIGKKVASIIVGGTSLSTRDIRFCGLQIYSGQIPALWIDRLDYPTLLPMTTRLKQIEDAVFTFPVLSVAPVITGTRTVGSTLTCSTGTWASTPSVSRYRYQWLRDGVILSGATSSTYVLQAGDANKAITCRVKATNTKGSRVCIANPVGITGTVYVLHLLGQSNMIGWGQGGSIDRSIDTTDFRSREYTPVLGENQFSDPNFESGVGSWAGLNTSLAVASNKLTGTVTTASFANINLALTGLVIGQKYIMSAKVGGTDNKGITFRLTAPQTQVFTTPKSGNSSYVDFEFTPSATTATLFLITTNLPTIGDTITIEDISLRPVLSGGAGSSIVSSDPLTWPLASQSASWGVCPASQAARDLLTAGASNVVVNPLAVGGTGLYNSVWAVGGTYQTNAVTQITKAIADYPVSGATHVLVWLQGEQDSLNGVSQANYQTALTDTLNSFRAISGLSGAKIIILGMMPEFIAANTNATNIVAAQQAVAGALSDVVYVASPSGFAQPDVLHFTAAGSRLIGSAIASNV